MISFLPCSYYSSYFPCVLLRRVPVSQWTHLVPWNPIGEERRLFFSLSLSFWVEFVTSISITRAFAGGLVRTGIACIQAS